MSIAPRPLRRRILVVALCLLAARPLSAANPESDARGNAPPPKASVCPICGRANNQQAVYPERAGGALMRGAMNTAFGWTEFLIQPVQEVKDNGNLLAGVTSGVGRATKRTFLGVGELFTFWVPKGRKGYLNLTTDCPICMGIRPPPQPTPASQETAKKN